MLKGGISAERGVSLESGAAIAAGLRRAGYDVTEIDVTSREFTVPEGVEAVFIALHGTFGEDGGAQARLEGLGIPYVGAGVESSRTAFDKLLTEAVFLGKGIPVPQSEVLRAGGVRTLPLPVAVKPPREGSSVGCHLVFDEDEWMAAFDEALTHDEEVLVQQFIPGREFTGGIVESIMNGTAQGTMAFRREVLPIVEIVPEKGWYDYAAKYESNSTRYAVPAGISAGKTAEMQALALKAFDALGARGFGRVDFRMNPEGGLFVLELNTIPGFTSHSLLPKAARAAGIDFPELCDRIMQTALL